ncbi:GDP-mannose transporter GONST1-like isoform X2 [Sesamum indicum]|uniref:GDP-mannose transporter GONST1-like isoform X2 n=1 Tax=Sesamum indicum TaxID=4182 RepID=A0A8M8UT86_SESIN|nr:GDP-mannose transporter GONST1-like isoform X2 [Sesamum indicum]
MASRSFGVKIPGNHDEVDVEAGRTEKDRGKAFRSKRVLTIHNQALLSGLAYCFSSCSMILVNNLRYINVAMVTVLKNVTNVMTAVGEMYLFNKHHDNRVWASLFLMIISAISGGFTDLSFHAIGYTWQFINCFLTASYSLTLRRVMDTAKQVTKSGDLNEFSMVMLNNTLSLPLGILLIFVFNEVDYLSRTPLLGSPTFWLVITFSGFLGLAISFTSMWFLHQTGATTYSLVGSLNKIPLSIAGIVLFNVPTSLENSASIFFGLLAGVLFARAKMR